MKMICNLYTRILNDNPKCNNINGINNGPEYIYNQSWIH